MTLKDSKKKKETWGLVQTDSPSELQRDLTKRNIGILITDHNVRETLKIVDRVNIVKEGSMFFEGKPIDAINDSKIKKFYLGTNFSI